MIIHLSYNQVTIQSVLFELAKTWSPYTFHLNVFALFQTENRKSVKTGDKTTPFFCGNPENRK
jgi:hypothetical protein